MWIFHLAAICFNNSGTISLLMIRIQISWPPCLAILRTHASLKSLVRCAYRGYYSFNGYAIPTAGTLVCICYRNHEIKTVDTISLSLTICISWSRAIQ